MTLDILLDGVRFVLEVCGMLALGFLCILIIEGL